MVIHVRTLRQLAFLALGLALVGCPLPQTRRVLVVPDEMRRAKDGTKPAGPGAPRLVTPKPIDPRTSTVRFAESGRVWEVDLPEANGGYEIRVPLANGVGTPEQPSAADEEILAGAGKESTDRPATSPTGSTVSAAGKTVDAKAQAGKKSYLGGLAKVSELYRSKRFELALIELVDLEHSFPEDARIQAMKGSLYVKLKRLPQAREAYERSLALNPDDIGVAEALREISEGN